MHAVVDILVWPWKNPSIRGQPVKIDPLPIVVNSVHILEELQVISVAVLGNVCELALNLDENLCARRRIWRFLNALLFFAFLLFWGVRQQLATIHQNLVAPVVQINEHSIRPSGRLVLQ